MDSITQVRGLVFDGKREGEDGLNDSKLSSLKEEAKPSAEFGVSATSSTSILQAFSSAKHCGRS